MRQMMEFHMAIPDFKDQPAADRFEPLPVVPDAQVNFQDGVVTLLWYLEKKNDSQDLSSEDLLRRLEEIQKATPDLQAR